jgi:hypothetical protein
MNGIQSDLLKSVNLLVNPNFDSGTQHWVLAGRTTLEDSRPGNPRVMFDPTGGVDSYLAQQVTLDPGTYLFAVRTGSGDASNTGTINGAVLVGDAVVHPFSLAMSGKTINYLGYFDIDRLSAGERAFTIRPTPSTPAFPWWIDYVVLVKVADPPPERPFLINGDFSQGATGWTLENADVLSTSERSFARMHLGSHMAQPLTLTDPGLYVLEFDLFGQHYPFHSGKIAILVDGFERGPALPFEFDRSSEHMVFVIDMREAEVVSKNIELRIVKLAPDELPPNPGDAMWLVDNVALRRVMPATSEK